MTIKISEMVEPDIWEPPYLIESLGNLKSLSDDYHFIIARTNNLDELETFKKDILPNKKNILILLSDELGINNWKSGPYFMKDQIHCIFRTYNNESLIDNEFVYPIPCGFSCGVGIHSENGKKNLYRNFEFSKKKLIDRKYDIFFSGQIDHHRNECMYYLDKISPNFNCIINKTNSFAKGFSIEEYYEHLENSKIAIVPRGVCVPESFRYFEAIKSGCIIISSYPIKDKKFQMWYYENSTAKFLDSWSELTVELINTLLSKDNLEKHEQMNEVYYKNNISPLALSQYIHKILKYKNVSI